MIHVIAIITTKPGQRAEVLAAFHENVPNVLAEEGCIEYRPVVDAAGAPRGTASFGSDTFAVIEKWSSLETLSAHAVSPHMKAYSARVADLLSDRSIHVLEDAS